jgi:cell division septal protein FtsQ
MNNNNKTIKTIVTVAVLIILLVIALTIIRSLFPIAVVVVAGYIIYKAVKRRKS